MKERKKIFKRKKFSKRRIASLKAVFLKYKISNGDAIIRDVEKLVFSNHRKVFTEQTFNIAEGRKTLEKIKNDAECLYQTLSSIDTLMVGLLAKGSESSEDLIKKARELMPENKSVSLEDVSNAEKVVYTKLRIKELQLWSEEALKNFPKLKNERPPGMYYLNDLVAQIAAIWRNHKIKPTLRSPVKDAKKPCASEPNAKPEHKKAYGPFLEFVQLSLLPILPKKNHSRSFEASVRKALYGKK